MSLTIAFRDARDSVASMALSLGFFDRVTLHEPKNAPGKGLTLAIFMGQFGAVQSSGLAATSVRFNLVAQLRCSMTREPQDDIDLDLLEAADALCAEINGDFDLGESVRAVDVFGMHGTVMGGEPGYVNHDGHMYRIIDVTVPCIVNDAWTQGA